MRKNEKQKINIKNIDLSKLTDEELKLAAKFVRKLKKNKKHKN